MAAGVEIGLLGPLLVRCEGVTVAVPPGKQRALLAVLLLGAGRLAPAGHLAELLWAPDPPPPTASVALRNNVLRLRRRLGPAGQHLIQTRPGGYLITPGDCELDLTQMERELDAARAAARAGDWERADVHADASLRWWRGEPMSDVDLPALTAQYVPRLNELRLQARELRLEADLALARPAEAVTELPPLIVAHPLRERLYALLMLALYRCGRRAEALDTYRAARDVLATEIGADPGPELQALHQQILHDDPALASPAPGTRPGLTEQPAHAARVVELPRQLPPAVGSFTGRDAELAALTSLLGPVQGPQASALVISAIAGTAGVGKTALAVQWAHQVAERFPDGQLYANLRGYDPGQPVTAVETLGWFLRALGVPGPDVPADDEERAACYRSLLAGRRILVVLDNAADADQVRPLLPGTAGSVALVTSRDMLAGLVARDGARRLHLDALPMPDAVSLLQTLIGARVDAEPEAATQLAAHCCQLPLALRVAAELAASRPGASLASLTGELTDQQRRLDLLDAGGDARTAVRAVFSWSLRHLERDTVRAFRLLGVHPGPDFDPGAAAALTGTSAEHARRVLDRLIRAHLIQSPVPDRYAMHDLLRDYARELAARDRTDDQCAALTRLFDYYLQSARVAMQALFPADFPADFPAESAKRPELPSVPANLTRLTDPSAARAWLAAELPGLVAAVAHAAAHGWPEHAIGLAATIFRYLDPGGHLTEAVSIHESARHAARQSGDVAAEARALGNLAAAELRQSRDEEAASHLLQAQALSHQLGDRDSEARALGNLGVLAFWQGRYTEAVSYYERAMVLQRETGNRTGEITGLCNLAGAQLYLHQYEQASAHLRTALAASREIGQQDGEAYALVILGDLSLRQGHLQQAGHYLEEGLVLCRHIGDRPGEAAALSGLGELELRQHRHEAAGRHLHLALALSRDAGARSSETDALHLLGELSLATGDHHQARQYQDEALALATLSGDAQLQARAHDALARIQQQGGPRC